MTDGIPDSRPASLSTRFFWWALLYVLATTALLASLYGIGRLAHVSMGSFHTGERGPYLQLPAPTAMTLRWQTPEAEIGVVRYGLQPDRLQWQEKEKSASEEHEVRLDGLQPGTRYYYAIGPEEKPSYARPDFWFHTSPRGGDPVPPVLKHSN